ncbi:MAG: alpha-2-macroglobulin [Ferruginibacter sp.]|nr:alpha-2-macroglobulin [Ferruginibacter sp.]
MTMFLKKLSLLLLIITNISTSLSAQTKNDYLPNWKKIEELEKKGLTKSALQEVMTIYTLAIKDNNDPQQIKSAMYQIRYRNMVEEDSRENNIFFADTLIARAKTSAKNILQSMQAEMLWQYLQNNRYKFYNRTKLAEDKSKDISTWSLDKLHATISTLYKASLGNEKLLKETKLDGFDPIIVKGQNTRLLRPTLFDFLAHRALAYFMNDERDLTKPAYSFTVNDPAAFAPATQFVAASFVTKDTASLHYKAIGLLRQILNFHLNDNNPDALIDADLIRLNFIHQHAVNENKGKLYEAALKHIEDNHAGNPSIAQAKYLRAKIYYDNGMNFHPFTKTDNQYEIKRAKEICDEVIKTFPKTEGYINCFNLSNQILQPSLNLETEKVNIPNQPFKMLVKYKNAKTVYFRIIKTSKEDIKKLDRRDYDKLWTGMIALKPTRNWNVNMPDLQDYQPHSAEIKADALPNGMYFILASLDEGFTLQKNILARQLIYLSNISYVHNSNNEYNVLHRETGQPLPGIQVQVWESRYNYNIARNEEIKAEQYSTDKNGYFKLKESKEYRNFLLQLTGKNDELFMDENNYSNYYNPYEQELKPVSLLFTDRSIYRPGQILYFKGIVLRKGVKPTETSIMPGFKSTLILKDVNGQKITELQMLTNEYGSYHGSFKLPEGVLNGQFSLFDETTNATHYFNVEEYKRPKFFVEVKKPIGTYRLFDSINVTGTAKAYAGNNIDGAAVKYRVVRKVRYQPWWYGVYGGYGRKIFPPGRPSEDVEIANGETTTDDKGEFSIKFKALPDVSINKIDQPSFYYEVNADITDINGETRSAETSVAVAYQAIQLSIDLSEKINADSLKNLKILSTNINDVFEKAKVSLTIHKVKSPGKIFRERYWEMPDQFVMSKDEFEGHFPYDVYKDEDQPAKWLLGEKVLDRTDSTNVNGQWAIGNSSFTAGWYKIAAITRDKYGEEVKAEKFILIQSEAKGKGGAEDPVTVTVQQRETEPGQKINYSIKTGFENIWMIHTLARMEKTNITSYQAVKASQPYQNEITINENDRGGMAMGYVFVQHNRVYKGEENFSIPWTNKDLVISYQTFRDKILPGSEEKWTAKITGNKGEKVVAEMLVSMYDASLDQFKTHNWSKLNIWPLLFARITWMENGFNAVNSEEYNRRTYDYLSYPKSFDRLLPVFLDYYERDRVFSSGKGIMNKSMEADMVEAPMMAAQLESAVVAGDEKRQVNIGYRSNWKKANTIKADSTANYQQSSAENNDIQVRKNFNETAFLLPELTTDADGNVSFSFTMPEALTRWKLMTLAHTKDLSSGYSEKNLVTQKPLMVQPNAPRFMREGDRMELSAKMVNLSENEITGIAQLELFDAATNKPVDGWFKNGLPKQNFTVAAGQSVAIRFPIEIPLNFNSALTYRITAKSSNNSALGAGGFSDGEESALPILTNRMLVTETLPLNLRNTNSKDFKFDKLLNSGSSKSISNHALVVEFTSNPAWYAVQALPYLMEYPYDCAEQTFNRFYANSLATYISNSMPKIKAVFEQWKTVDTAALLSNLQKNEALKSALLQETPWVLDAQNEQQQKKNIALLFDMVKMSGETEKAISKLNEMQSPNGGFVWFKGGPDDRYMTQYILAGIGHLRKLNALSANEYKKIKQVTDKAVPYLDKKIKEDYDNLVKYKATLKNNNLSYTAVQYLYMRSFFNEYAVPAGSQTAYNYYRGQAKTYWLSNEKYMQAMIALALHRTNDETTPRAIIRSLKENSISKEEMGMYWKEWTTGGYYWHQAPIESQAMMIEAFTDIDKNTNTINDLKTWLLKQKQTQNWKTTKATAEACYALLLDGSNWLSEEKEVEISVGNSHIKSTESKTETGTGYFKKTIPGENVQPNMGNISVTLRSAANKNPPSGGKGASGAWGAVYWQYFEDLDKITPAATPLKLSKQLFVEKNTDKGPVLQAIADGASLNVGDKIKVRIELRVDRDMEYVHMKDMRAACMEPVNVISEYKYQGGLGYYETTKDASTNFFFGWLARGTYVFEYPMFVTHTGNFSNGITTIQCMYAPEFTSHSEGIRVNVQRPPAH